MNPSEASRPATGFCQNCGKPLYPETARAADGLVLCEPCLLQRHPAGAPPFAGWTPVGTPGPNPAGYTSVPYTPAGAAPSGAGVNPGLAGLLGAVPGVGAMYNGQFIKALVHVVVFVVLVGIAESYDYAGWLIAAWVFYQIFDAAQTAAARRDGTPLPDPFGILEWSRRVGPQSQAATYGAPYVAAGTPPVPPSVTAGPVAPPYRTPAQAAPEADTRRGESTGAVVLIVVGVLFLLSNFGILRASVLARSWPILLLALGVWLLVRRVRSLPAPGVLADTADAPRGAFSVAPDPTQTAGTEPKEDRQ